jgi:tetratricopeptide (TPR) repeat protein
MSKSKTKSSTASQDAPGGKGTAGTAVNQLSAFDEGMKLFHQRDFQGALAHFDIAGEGSDVTVAHTAKLHARMCRQRLETDRPQLNSSEDNYAYGLSLAHRRELSGAEQYLQRALQLAPRADHVLYTLALVKGLQGDIPSAAAFLSRAIEIQPGTRTTARTDPEFHELLHHQPIRDLVY